MSNLTREVLETILDKAHGIARSETLIGDPIRFENLLVVPVIKVSVGFGAGGGQGNDGDKGSKSGGSGVGAGGGIRVEPSCFLVHDGTTVRVLSAAPTKGKGMDGLIEKLPDLLTYAMDSLRGQGEKAKDEGEDE